MTNINKDRTGFDNTGEYNSGDKNTGCMNSGDWNTGDWNAGMKNAGCRNEGDWNTGDFNKGNFCSGDWNMTDKSTGVFCCKPGYIRMFDLPTQLTLEDWRRSHACRILSRVRTSRWSHAEGYLEEISLREGCLRLWKSLSEDERRIIFEMPNFNAAKFERITGINTGL